MAWLYLYSSLEGVSISPDSSNAWFPHDLPTVRPTDYSLYAGFIHLGAGLACGFTGLAAGYAIGYVGDSVSLCHYPSLFLR